MSQVGVYKQRERRLIAEYVAEKFPKDVVTMGAPLGAVLPNAAAEMTMAKAIAISRPYRPEVDALVKRPDLLILLEAKIIRITDGFAKLQFYRDLIPSTPELEGHKDAKVEARLIVPMVPSWLPAAAQARNIVVDMYAPAWIQEYAEELNRYWTPEGRAKRDARRAAIQGVVGGS